MPISRQEAVKGTYILFVLLILIAPALFDVFWLNRLSKFLVFGMLGISMSLCWGYAGILNLGQGLFFGLGAYSIGMSLKLASATSLQQGSTTPIPDFMLSNAEPGAKADLCCINAGSFLWMPFNNQYFGLAVGIVLPVVIAFIIGNVVFRKRIAGVFVSIITLAIVLLTRMLVVQAQPFTNGFNGLTDLGYLSLLGVEFDPYALSSYYLIAFSLIAVLAVSRFITATRAGLILQASRDDDRRARFLGFDVASYQLFFFCVAAAISGYAGMLYVVASGFVSPTFMDLSFSISMVIWAAVGGRHSLLGACIGAILINLVQATVSETPEFVEAWTVVMGLAFIMAVLFLPRGIAGICMGMAERFFTRDEPPPGNDAHIIGATVSAPGEAR